MKLHDKIAGDLTPGETILWHARPSVVGVLFRSRILGGILFLGVLATIFVGIPGSPIAFGALMAALVFASIVYEVVVGFGTSYAITTKRLIILRPGLSATNIDSYYPPDIDFVRKTKRGSGAGSIVFAAIREKSSKRTETVQIGFFGIDDVDRVEEKILALRTPQNA